MNVEACEVVAPELEVAYAAEFGVDPFFVKTAPECEDSSRRRLAETVG